MKIDWPNLCNRISDHIKSVNFKNRMDLKGRNIELIKAKGRFLDAHRVVATFADQSERVLESKFVLIAVGSLPSIPNIPGARELGITTDQLFSMANEPGKTLVVGDGCKFQNYVSIDKFIHFNVSSNGNRVRHFLECFWIRDVSDDQNDTFAWI